MKRRLALLGALFFGCTSVRVAQRGDCWVRTVTTWPNQVTEDVGPCTRPTPAWTNDRLTRLVQECVAQRDYRWQNLAMSAWQAHQPLPARDEKQDLDECLSEATRTAVGENEQLKTEVKDLTAERDRLRAHDDQITSALGEAAKKPAGSAVATASAEGKGDGASHQDSKSEESHHSEQASTAQPPMIVQPPASQPVILQIAPPAPAPQPILLQSPAAPAPQPIVVQSQAPMPYPLPQTQPIILQTQPGAVQPIVVNAPQPETKTVVRYVRVPAKPHVVKKRLCPPTRSEASSVSAANTAKDDCVTPAN